jgi:hypothetical protein
MSQKTKQIIIAVIVIGIAFFGFKMFFTSDVPSDVSLSVDGAGDTYIQEGQEILVLLEQLSNINLDNSIFSNQIFLSLVNFEKPLEPQIEGRPNPFLPIGRDTSSINPVNIITDIE